MKKTFLIAAIALCATLWPQISLAQFVFRITGNELKEPSYIIGTVHTIDGSLLDSIPEYQEAVAQCRQLYTEMDPNGKVLENYLKEVKTLYELPDSTNIFKIIDEWIPTKESSINSNSTTENDLNLSELLKERMLQELNINLDDSITKPMWNKSPLFFTDTLNNSIKEKVKDQLFGQCELIDDAIIRQAHERGWKVSELDELDFLPLTMLKPERMTLDLQMRMLKSILTHFEEYEQREKSKYTNERLQQCFEFVRRGDFDIFVKQYSSISFFFYDSFYKVKSRNEMWLPKIKQAMQEAPTLFDFGAGHLVGDDGVLKMLRDAGYEVTLLTKKRE